jgi:Ca2+:H+ antiporter
MHWLLVSLLSVALIAVVFLAVHHAEVVAHRVGEPFGTLVLALAVTVIESSLIVSMMLADHGTNRALARDTIYATVMIVCNFVLGACLLAGALRHRVLAFRVEGASPALSVLIALATLTLVLPTMTLTTPGPSYSSEQLAFAGVMSLVLYGVFLFVQTVRHRDYFLPLGGRLLSRQEAQASSVLDEDQHAAPPSKRKALVSLGVLLVALVAVVALAKTLSPSIEAGVEALAAPQAVVGIAIALLVLMPETLAAVNAALRDRMQTCLNLALGSALATIGLTVPTVAAVSIFADLPLDLGLPPKEMTLLALTLLISVVTLASGRATILQGAVHLVLFAVFLFLSIVP